MMGGDTMEKQRVAIYCRVARDDAFSLEAQAANLRHYAEQAGYTVVSVTAENGSGLRIARPGLAAVSRAVFEGKADLILVKSLDRITRRYGLMQRYVNYLRKHKVTLLCVSEGLEIGDRNLYPFFSHKKSGVSLQDAQIL